jgi:sialate O-acetylesterase
MKLKFSVVLQFLIVIPGFLKAQIRLPKILANNMVLQRNRPVPVWGWGKPGKTVIVNFAGQRKMAVVAVDSTWKIMLSSLKANNDAQSLIIESDTSKVILNNILVGEVWLASGQSNMEYQMQSNFAKPAKGIDSTKVELNTHNSLIRLLKVERKLSIPDITTTYGWQEAGQPSLSQFSAAAYYFAKSLYNKLHVPIGIISSSWGGSRIEPWTPQSAYESLPAFKNDVGIQPLKIDSAVVGQYYRSMIRPLAPFALHGFIWYQGESNCMLNEPNMRYADKMQALIYSWRKVWGNEELPFYSVLIAPYYYSKRKDHVPHTPETLPEFWAQQIQSTKITNTDIINVSDLVDNLKDIHPSYKWEVGRRLALVALAKDYGYTKTIYSGPRYKKSKIKGNKIIVYFDHARGLKTNDGKPLDNFTIAGEDGRFVTATSVIRGNRVIVSSPDVIKPLNVRFAWIETAEPNLVNRVGLPAFPFKTDEVKWNYMK